MKTYSLFFFIIILVISSIPLYGGAAENMFPKKNSGKKWRIGYLEGGPYTEYPLTLIATIEGLMELGWIEKTKIPYAGDDKTNQLWQWMVKNLQSEYIQIVADAHWTTDWKHDQREFNRTEILKRLNQKRDIDLMIAMGTWAGQDLANDKHSISTIIMSVSDAVKSGIVPSVNDSGHDHVHVRVDLTRYLRQLRFFHETVGFKKLGIAYQNDLEGKTYAALADVETVAKEAGFEIVPCFIPFIEERELGENYADGVNCMEELAPQVDAIYIIQHTSQDLENIPNLLVPLLKYRIPTFAQGGSAYVRYGALMSSSFKWYKYDGEFHAKTIAQVFNGTKPGKISQFFGTPTRIAINLATAEKIGFVFSDDILDIADEVYQEILK